MPFPSQVGLIVVVIIALFIILWLIGNGRRSRSRGAPHRESRIIRGIKDHGAHIARQHGHERSPEWHRVAMAHRLREPACVVCGYKGKKVQVHHIKPFHLHPQLELDPNNLITLCEARGREHHLLLGHLDSWESYNEHIRADAKHFYRKSSAQIRADLAWLKKVQSRP